MRSKNTLNRQTLSRVIECLVCIVLGFALGLIFVNFPPFEFEWNFNVVDFLGLLLTFVILFYLQNALSNRVSDDRVEKDILIDAANSVVKGFKQIRESCRVSASEESQVAMPGPTLAQFKDLSNDIHSLELLLENTPIRLDMDCVKKIRRKYLEIKRLATSNGYPHQRLKSEDNAAVQIKINSTIALVYRTIFYLNRL